MPARSVAMTLVLLVLTLAACTPAPSSAPSSFEDMREPTELSSPALERAGSDAGGPALRRAADAARPAAPAAGVGSSAAAPMAPAGVIAAPPSLPAPVPATTSESSTQLPMVQNLGRMIIYTTDLVVVIENLDAFPNHAGTIALAHGGYVAGVETREENGLPTTIVRLKVPPARYEAAMQELRALAAEVREEKATTRDVTEEHDDVETQIASLEATHAQLLRLLDRAGSIEEVLKVQQQAAQVKNQIDRLKGRLTALERLSEFATITVKAHLASVAFQRDYTAVRAALRRAEATRANLEAQLKRVRTPDEETAIRDKLGEALLEITRLQGRLADVEARAAAARVTLPTAESTTSVARLDETLPKEYIETRVALRRAQHEQAELTRAIRAGRPDADPSKLAELILRVNQLSGQLRTIQERAQQAAIALPPLTAEQETVLAGLAPAQQGGFDIPVPIRAAWEGSLTVLLAIASGLVFVWWALPLAALAAFYVVRRRAPVPTPAAEV